MCGVGVKNEFGILGEFTQVDTPQRLQIPGLERVQELALSKIQSVRHTMG